MVSRSKNLPRRATPSAARNGADPVDTLGVRSERGRLQIRVDARRAGSIVPENGTAARQISRLPAVPMMAAPLYDMMDMAIEFRRDRSPLRARVSSDASLAGFFQND